MTQKKLADSLGIGQSTVSRALNKESKRHGKARARIFTLMQERRRDASPAQAVEAIWDGTAEHAQALRRLIEASEQLWRGPGKEKR